MHAQFVQASSSRYSNAADGPATAETAANGLAETAKEANKEYTQTSRDLGSWRCVRFVALLGVLLNQRQKGRP